MLRTIGLQYMVKIQCTKSLEQTRGGVSANWHITAPSVKSPPIRDHSSDLWAHSPFPKHYLQGTHPCVWSERRKEELHHQLSAKKPGHFPSDEKKHKKRHKHPTPRLVVQKDDACIEGHWHPIMVGFLWRGQEACSSWSFWPIAIQSSWRRRRTGTYFTELLWNGAGLGDNGRISDT